MKTKTSTVFTKKQKKNKEKFSEKQQKTNNDSKVVWLVFFVYRHFEWYSMDELPLSFFFSSENGKIIGNS
ncbi:hypothetical protein HPB00_03190 [Streptococcus suis]|nr:hypothetical protein [Streptococcus suis]